MASFTLNYSSVPVSRAVTVTATGSGTAWTSGTTFPATGGTSPSITGLSVNVGAQKATFTLNPGPDTGTLTIHDSTDAATATITVATSVTFSGSNLTAWNSDPTYLFDPVSEFTPEAIGHTITISGGTGLTPGTYTIQTYSGGASLGAQGTHNLVRVFQLGSTTVGAATGAASGGTWSYLMGPGGSGYSGSNLTPWARDVSYYFDPDAPLASGLNGATVAISGGTGFASGTYTVTAFVTAQATGGQGTQNLIKVALLSGHFPAAAGAYGATWSRAGGDTIPTPTVNTALTGPVKVVLIGDSITARQTTSTATALQAQYPNAASVTVSNQGVSGSTSADWLPAASTGYLTAAEGAANAIGATAAFVMLGTNDAKCASGNTVNVSSATHQSNVQAITTHLKTNVATLRYVVLMEQPYVVPGTTGWSADTSSDTALQAYYATYASVTGVVQGASSSTLATETNYTYFSRNPQALADGVHPTTSGTAEVNYTWLTSAAASLVAAAIPLASTVPNAFLPAHLRTPHGRTRVGPGVKTH